MGFDMYNMTAVLKELEVSTPSKSSMKSSLSSIPTLRRYDAMITELSQIKRNAELLIQGSRCKMQEFGEERHCCRPDELE